MLLTSNGGNHETPGNPQTADGSHCGASLSQSFPKPSRTTWCTGESRTGSHPAQTGWTGKVGAPRGERSATRCPPGLSTHGAACGKLCIKDPSEQVCNFGDNIIEVFYSKRKGKADHRIGKNGS